MRALADLTIVDLTTLLPGPYCTQVLADLGARVIMIETPRPSDLAAVELTGLRRGKQSVVLDLKAPAGRDLLGRLLARADVLVESFRPAVAARLGLDEQSVRRRFEHLIHCSLTGYGRSGPRAQHAGHDLNYQAVAGLLGLGLACQPTTAPGSEAPPARAPQPAPVPGLQVADLAGSLYAVIGILAGLHARGPRGPVAAAQQPGPAVSGHAQCGPSGQQAPAAPSPAAAGLPSAGQHLDLALADAGLALLPLALHFHEHGAPLGTGRGLLDGGYACYATYATADGQHLALGALEPKFFARVCAALGRPELAGWQYAAERQAELRAALAAAFAGRALAGWQPLLDDPEACCTPVRSLAEALEDPGLQARGMLGRLPDGTRHLGSPLRLSATPPATGLPPPRHGEHGPALAAELGYSPAEIAALQAARVLG